MKNTFKTLFLLLIGASLLPTGCAHRNPAAAPSATAPVISDEPPSPAAKPPAAAGAEQPALTNLQDRVGYAIGMSVGGDLVRRDYDVNLDQLMQGLRDMAARREPRMTEQQARETIMEYGQQRQREKAIENEKAGAAFLEENKKKEGVQVKSVTLPDGATAEFQYRIITEGTGEIPKSNENVRVNYQGTLIDGKEFDSSARHGGRPARFMVSQVIRGWSEALQMMKEGSKWELFIPANLAYGDRPSPTIPPGSTLIFQVELVEIDRPKPLTSDIIRVPSAEEMKAGAKIEVIKAEDAEKMAAAQTNTPATQAPDKK